jgi:LacI family transcriptional regulator
MDKEITIYDLAKNLGISPTTVSRALNHHPSVNEKTKKRIFHAANEMGYRSNIFASNLRRKKTNNIGVIVPRLNSPFQSSVIAGMEKVANEAGFNLVISQSLESLEKEITNANMMFNSRVDGLLVSLVNDPANIDHFKPFFNKGIPLLFFDRIADQPQCTGVIIDNAQAAYDATQHLISEGCKNIVHVLGNTKINVYANRLKGYRYALMDNNIPFLEKNIIYSDLSEEAGESIVEKILNMKERPDGLFVSNDSCAASCIKVLKQEGIRIPEDLAVVGFNNDMLSRLMEPNLTTVNYPGFEMGQIAMKSLVHHLEGILGEILQKANTITLRSELIIRESSLKSGKIKEKNTSLTSAPK